MKDLSEDQLIGTVNDQTLLKLTPIWTRNIVENEPLFENAKGVLEFFYDPSDVEHTVNVPVIIVASGPSLDKNIHLLKEVKDKAIIISVDTALKKVMEQGVDPDFVVVTDAVFSSAKACFGDLPRSTKDINLLVDVFCNKKVLADWEGPIYWYAVGDNDTGSYLGKVVEQSFVKKPIGRLSCGGNVTSIAVSFAYGGLKCDPVILLGADCGYYQRKQTHADGVNVGMNQTYEEVIVDNHGIPFITTPQMKAFKIWLENLVSGKFDNNSSYVKGTMINCTEGGIINKGWLLLPFEFAINKYLTKTYNIKERIVPRYLNRKNALKQVSMGGTLKDMKKP